ncbi:unnamed protein product [Boreogadus saida]
MHRLVKAVWGRVVLRGDVIKQNGRLHPERFHSTLVEKKSTRDFGRIFTSVCVEAGVELNNVHQQVFREFNFPLVYSEDQPWKMSYRPNRVVGR